MFGKEYVGLDEENWSEIEERTFWSNKALTHQKLQIKGKIRVN
jgi:hypothetical protein